MTYMAYYIFLYLNVTVKTYVTMHEMRIYEQ